MNKKEILKECKILTKTHEKFLKAKDKLNEKFPEAHISVHLNKTIKGDIFFRKHEEHIYYIPKNIVYDKVMGMIFIECERTALFEWSTASLNRITVSEFEKKFLEAPDLFISLECKSLMRKHVEGIEHLEKSLLGEELK